MTKTSRKDCLVVTAPAIVAREASQFCCWLGHVCCVCCVVVVSFKVMETIVKLWKKTFLLAILLCRYMQSIVYNHNIHTHKMMHTTNFELKKRILRKPAKLLKLSNVIYAIRHYFHSFYNLVQSSEK